MKQKGLLVLLMCMVCFFCGNAALTESEEDEYPIIFEKNGLWGAMDEQGTVIIPPIYAEISGFSNGYSRITDSEGYIGLIDDKGTVIAECKYDSVTIPNDGYFVAAYEDESDNHYSYYYEFFHDDGTPTGWRCDFSWGFHEGYADVSLNGAEYMMDTEGNLYNLAPYSPATGQFHEGRLLVRKDNLYGYLDRSLQLVIPCQYIWAHEFYDGTAFVETDGGVEKIDRDGNIVDDAIDQENPFKRW